MVAGKMAGTKWYGQNGIGLRTKYHWTNWYGQSGTEKW